MNEKLYRLVSDYDGLISVIVNGKQQIVRFTNGSRICRRRGYFTTSDKQLQEVLESTKEFGLVYVLDSIKSKPQKANNIQEQGSIESYLSDKNNVTYNDTVTTKRMAIAYIQGVYGESFSNPTASVDDLKREAARRWNIIFTKW